MSGAIYEAGRPPLRKLPVLIVHGTEDDMIPLWAAQRTRLVLEENGVDAGVPRVSDGASRDGGVDGGGSGVSAGGC